MTPEADPPVGKPDGSATTRRGWLLLLILPYLALCFPELYARATPAVFGFPFFYWYQFAWVLITSAILGLVYLATRDRSA
jgi:hypothetical protein